MNSDADADSDPFDFEGRVNQFEEYTLLGQWSDFFFFFFKLYVLPVTSCSA